MNRDSFAVFAFNPRSDKSEYAPATVASDISRILDPSYTPSPPPHSPHSPGASTSSPSGAGGYTQAKAYVDHAGDMHDPDWRDFPAALPTSRRLSDTTRSRRASSSMRYAGRPPWERSFDDAEGADGADGGYGGRWPGGNNNHTASIMTFVSARPRSGSTSTMNTLIPPEPINFHHRPSFEEEVVFEEDEPPAATKEQAHDDDDRPTPTCMQALRYQIQSIRLSFRLKIVRTQRRWRERRKNEADG